MKKRNCIRFSIPGTTLYYKKKPGLLFKSDYPDQYFPVLNMSRGGALFLCNERLEAGKPIIIKLQIPGTKETPEIFANVRWISKNPEASYQYRTGIEFNSYGDKKNQNPETVLALLRSLE